MVACPYSAMPCPTVPCVANASFSEFPLPVNERDGNLFGKGLWVITVIEICRN